MSAAAILATSGLLLAADAGTAKAAQILARHFSDDFTGETEADILPLIEAVRAPNNEHPGDSMDLTETDLRTSRHSSPEESDAHTRL
jgi:sensor domain CHASE-containing protein